VLGGKGRGTRGREPAASKRRRAGERVGTPGLTRDGGIRAVGGKQGDQSEISMGAMRRKVAKNGGVQSGKKESSGARTARGGSLGGQGKVKKVWESLVVRKLPLMC